MSESTGGQQPPSASTSISRREFVTTAAAAGAGVMIVPRTVLGRGFQAPSDTVNVATVGIQPVPVLHGARPVLGFRFGSFAYLTDCNRLADEAWDLLGGLDVLILDALRHRPHPTHFSVGEALQVVERLRPQQTYLTHICHDLPHDATNKSLPPGVELGYDGLTFAFEAAPAFAAAAADKPGTPWT